MGAFSTRSNQSSFSSNTASTSAISINSKCQAASNRCPCPRNISCRTCRLCGRSAARKKTQPIMTSAKAVRAVNPRTPAQVAVRGNFRAVSARWRTLTQEQRDVWIAVAWTKWSKSRLGTGRLTGCQFFVKTNVPLANHGKPQVDLPLEYSRSTKPPVMAVFRIHPSSFILQPLLAGVVVSKRDTRTGRTLLRYRACTVVPPYQHHSNTLAGRCVHFCPQDRLRFRCRSQPPRCRSEEHTSELQS